MVNVRDGIKCAHVTNQQVQVLLKGNTGAPVSNQRTRGFAEQAHHCKRSWY